MVKLVWTELSTEDLKEIFDYIAKDSVQYASIKVNKIYNRAQDIIDNVLPPNWPENFPFRYCHSGGC